MAEQLNSRWEDQELNYATPEGKFPEVLAAKFVLLGQAENAHGKYIHVDQTLLESLPLRVLKEVREKPRIDRICLHYRLSCGFGPGGEKHPVLGVIQYSSGSSSRYAIVQISPKNDWLEILSIAAVAPNQVRKPMTSNIHP